MNSETSDALLAGTAAQTHPEDPPSDRANPSKFGQDFWWELINEKDAADFIDLKPRTLQGMRYRGRGPPFVRISSRCIKYRRIDLLRWAEDHLRQSTSDTGSNE